MQKYQKKDFHKSAILVNENDGVETLKWVLRQCHNLNTGLKKKWNELDYVDFFNSIDDLFFINSLYPNQDNFILSVRTKSGTKKFKYIEDFYPYFFYEDRKFPVFIDTIKDKVLITYDHPGKTKSIRSQFKGTFEADILYDIRFYVDIMTIFRKKINSGINFRIWYADIEVYAKDPNERFNYDSDKNFINAINIFDNFDNILYSLIIGNKEDIEKEVKIGNDIVKQKIKFVKTEKELIYEFFWLYLEKLPDFITFWNAPFDIQFIFHKSKKYVDKILELWNLYPEIKLNKKRDEEIDKIFFRDLDFRGEGHLYHIYGSTTMDMLVLYQKSAKETREEYSLDYISKVELGSDIGGKVEYEGTLEDLFDNNLDKFIEYSSTDAYLLYLIDKKMELITKFIVLSDISYLPIRYFNRDFTNKLNDCLYLQFLIPMNKVCRTKEEDTEKEKYVGAHVHLPIPGIYDWFIDLDASSMYPSIIISANISPDTFLFAFKEAYKKVKENNEEKLVVDHELVQKLWEYIKYGKHAEFFDNGERHMLFINPYLLETYIRVGWLRQEYLKSKKTWIFTPAGVIFRGDVKGIMPMIMEYLINQRKYFKMMKKFVPR